MFPLEKRKLLNAKKTMKPKAFCLITQIFKDG